MAELDRQYAEQIAWLIQWRKRCDELIETGRSRPKSLSRSRRKLWRRFSDCGACVGTASQR